jgi:hypothetical protein
METPESSLPAQQVPQSVPSDEARILRMWVAVSLVLIVGLGFFLGYWGRLQKIGEPGVKIVRRDVHLMPQKIGKNDTLESLKIIATNSVDLPESVLNYRSGELPLQALVYDTLPKDTTFGQRMYQAPDGLRIQNTVVLMGADRTSIHKPEFCLVGSGWQILKSEEVVIPMLRPIRYNLPAMRMTSRQERQVAGKREVIEGVYVFWFVSGDKLTARHRERMWWMARDLITRGELQRWAYVIAFAIGNPGETGQTDALYERLSRFVQASVPEYQLVPAVGSATAALR